MHWTLKCVLAVSFSANMHGVCKGEDDVLMTCALHRAYLGLKKYEDAVESLQKVVGTALSNLAVLVVDECLSCIYYNYTGSGPGADR